jgi:N-acyl-D-aspartate/D-glutamate deacylase
LQRFAKNRSEAMFDFLVRGALVFDGTGRPPKVLDLAVTNGRIVALEESIQGAARELIDAQNYWLTPGFLDIHTHYDLEVELTPGLPESVRHGVTSVVMGNCSLSLTFGDSELLGDIFQRVETLPKEMVQKWLNDGLRGQDPETYFCGLRSLTLGPNIAPLLGHSALRAHVMGFARSLHESATDLEIATMVKLATAALDAGCIGISVDMVHWHKVSGPWAGRSLPSHHADKREVKALAELCRSRDRVFQVTPDPSRPMSFIEILALSPGLFRAPLRNTILSALDMSLNRHFWRLFPAILFIFNRLLGCNIRFQTLSEPFTIYCDGPLTPFFEEFECGVVLNSCQTSAERRRYWENPSFKAEFSKQWTRGWPRTFHRDLSQIFVVSAPDKTLVDRSIEEIARAEGRDPVDHFMDLLERFDTELRWVSTGANHRTPIRQALMAHRHILPGFSDAGAHCRNLAFFDSALSVLRQSVQTAFLPPEKAIARVTSEPARWFQLDTGELKVGAKADFLLLDKEKLQNPIPRARLQFDEALGVERMVKRDDDPAVHGVFIAGERVVIDGEVLDVLGKKALGDVLEPMNQTSSAEEALWRHRNRLSDVLVDHPFTEYWDVFVLKHQRKENIWLHCFAVVLMYLVPLLALLLGQAWILLLWPITQSTGLLGHYFFEPSPIDTRDSVFSWRAFSSLNRMFILVMTGRYGRELIRLQGALEAHRAQKRVEGQKAALGGRP